MHVYRMQTRSSACAYAQIPGFQFGILAGKEMEIFMVDDLIECFLPLKFKNSS